MTEYYRVEKILAKRITAKNQSFYKIKWEGYPESQCTWEPIKNLQNVVQMIYDFEAQYKAQPKLMPKLRLTKLKEQAISTTPIEPPKRTLSRVYQDQKQMETKMPSKRQYSKKMAKKHSSQNIKTKHINLKTQNISDKQLSFTHKQSIKNDLKTTIANTIQFKPINSISADKNEVEASSFLEEIESGDTQSLDLSIPFSDVLEIKDISLDKENDLIYLAERRGLRFYISKESAKQNYQLALLTFLEDKISSKPRHQESL